MTSAVGADPVLRLEHISKTFPGTRALDDVTLELKRGEIHALVGNNGSGKSTLIKILAGVESSDAGGRIVVAGRSYDAQTFTPREAKRVGLHFVHQVPALFPWLSVAENLAIGRGFETARFGAIRWRAQNARARQLIERFHIRALPEMPLVALDPADRTLVAIARALQDQDGEQGGVLVLDEPTAALPGPEVERLLETLRSYAASGQTILYVSHHLDEILRTSHRVSALRDGKHVGTRDTSELDERQIVGMMLGRALDSAGSKDTQVGGPTVLAIENLQSRAVHDVSLTVARGEIVGLAGIVGSGAAELLSLVFGATRPDGGQLKLEGAPFAPRDPADAIIKGLAFLPADRALDASFASMSLRANLSAPRVPRYFRGFRLRHDLERRDARDSISTFLVRASSEEQALGTLSGGNQQKVVLARWLHDRPKLFLLNEPTQGVDVHARQEIHQLLRAAASAGTAILVVSSDFRELSELCDRALVMAKGKIVAELSRPDIDTHRLTELSHFAP
jgi:ribose transport system ATP-binding protein